MKLFQKANVNSILLTIIICTHRRPDSLPHTLESLVRQNWVEGDWEIIVVENDLEPSSAVSEIIKNFSSRLPLRYCLEKILNLSRARNRGAQLARGEYLAYIDDDAEVTKEWLEALITGLKKHQPDFCGGPSYPLYRTHKPAWFRDEYAIEYVYGDRPRALNYSEWLGGMNFIVRRDVVFSVGGFRENLGMAGGKIAYGEETCLLMAGWKNKAELNVMYFPAVAVHHEVRPIKMTLLWNIKSWWACGRDCAAMRLYGNKLMHNMKQLIYQSAAMTINLLKVMFIASKGIVSCDKNRYKRYIMDNMKSNIYWLSYCINSICNKLK